MRPFLPAGVVLALILSAGVVHGVWTSRWGLRPDIQAAADRLKNVPAVIGEWTAVDLPVDERQLQIAEAVGYLSRRYVRHGGSGLSEDAVAVNVMVLCGPTGPMAVHPPTVCFTGVGLVQTEPERRVKVVPRGGSRPEELFDTVFVRRDPAVPLELHTKWAWNPGDGWRAPDRTRFAFAGAPYLYKLYVTRELVGRTAGSEEASPSDPTIQFLEVFLPELQKALVDSTE